MQKFPLIFGVTAILMVIYFAVIGFSRMLGEEAGRSAAKEFQGTLLPPVEDLLKSFEPERKTQESAEEIRDLEHQIEDLKEEQAQRAAEKTTEK